MVIITGAAGFIGSNLITKLNGEGLKNLVLVDDFTKIDKEKNYASKQFIDKIERGSFFSWLDENYKSVDFIFHLGARTDTTEFNKQVFDELNLEYSQKIWKKCAVYDIPVVYASSAATYGMGELGYDDDHKIIKDLKPLNPYGDSKNEFDKWVLSQKEKPRFWAGLKFFNVYGPNEYHKGRMASVIFHAFNQISKTKAMKLFRSHHPDFKDGGQQRDFIYVKDVVEVMYFLMNHKNDSGIYNLGTGKARTFLDLVKSTFKSMGLEDNVEFIDTPEDIRDKYQYFTQAKMEKLRSIGFEQEFTTLEEGVGDYITNYLATQCYN